LTKPACKGPGEKLMGDFLPPLVSVKTSLNRGKSFVWHDRSPAGPGDTW
jgi:hypothetical protein